MSILEKNHSYRSLVERGTVVVCGNECSAERRRPLKLINISTLPNSVAF